MSGKTMSVSEKKQGEKKQGLHNTLVYVKQHWQLYVIFLFPALILTLIFKYIPMGGILIAFQRYNPIRGIMGSEWVGLTYFKRFLSSPDFMRYLVNTLKLSIYGLLWGFPIPKSPAYPLYAKLCFCNCTVRYCKNFSFRNRSGKPFTGHKH